MGSTLMMRVLCAGLASVLLIALPVLISIMKGASVVHAAEPLEINMAPADQLKALPRIGDAPLSPISPSADMVLANEPFTPIGWYIKSVVASDSFTSGDKSKVYASLPDLFRGVYSYSVPLDIPPGRVDFTPNITFTYSSAATNAEIGVGWALSGQRIILTHSVDGAQQYEVQDGMANARLLLTASTAEFDEYRAKVEGDFTRYRRYRFPDGSTRWSAEVRDGTHLSLGSVPSSRVTTAQDITIEWRLDHAEDDHGNQIEFSYLMDHGRLYLHFIRYARRLGGSSVPNNLPTAPCQDEDTFLSCIQFDYEERLDNEVSYRDGLERSFRWRLVSVRTFLGRATYSNYVLGYHDSSPVTGRSLLASIKRVGADTSITELIASFEYASEATAWSRTDWNVSSPRPSIEQILLGDFNGDSRIDMASLYPDGIPEWSVHLSTGGAFSRTTLGTAPDVPYHADGCIIFFGNGACTSIIMPVPWAGISADFNRDGLADIAYAYPFDDNVRLLRASSRWIVNLSDADHMHGRYWTHGPIVTVDVPSILVPVDKAGIDKFSLVRLCKSGDYNGDRRADLACFFENNWQVALAMDVPLPNSITCDNCWQTTNWPNGPQPQQGNLFDWIANCHAGDVDGDRQTDLFCQGNSDRRLWNVSRSNGHAFVASVWSLPQIAGREVKDCVSGDFNADTLTDLVCRISSTATSWALFLSNGSSWTLGPNSLQENGPDVSEVAGNCFTGDLNGDARQDLVCKTTRDGTVKVAFSRGDHLDAAQTWVLSSGSGGDFAPSSCSFADYNGDGAIDIACFPQGNSNIVAVGKISNPFPDSLTVVTNKYGGVITVRYAPASSFPGMSLPFPLKIVGGIETATAPGGELNANYTYSNGLIDFDSGEFRGFGIVTETLKEANSSRVLQHTVRFNQSDLGLIGQLTDEQWSTDENETLHRTFLYGPDLGHSGAVFRPIMKTATEYATTHCHGQPCATTYRDSEVEYYWDRFGNLEGISLDSDPDSPGGKVLKVMAYTAPNELNWELGRLETVREFSDCQVNRASCPTISNLPTWATSIANRWSGLRLMSSTELGYASTMDCGSIPRTSTTSGRDITWIRRGLGLTSSTVMTVYGYDDAGNVQCRRNPNGHTHTLQYDDQEMFVVKITNALKHETRFEYAAFGPTSNPGRLVAVSDPNQATTRLGYDPFGRLNRVISPDGYETSSEVTIDQTSHEVVLRTSDTLDRHREHHLDGSGRIYLSKEWVSGGTITKKTVFDGYGRVTREYLPFLSSVAQDFTEQKFDGWGRLVSLTRPDGTKVTVCYDYRELTIIDSNRNKTVKRFDGRGNLIAVDQYYFSVNECYGAKGFSYTRSYTFDSLGNVSGLCDPENNCMSVSRDGLGRPENISLPGFQNYRLSYDYAGNVVEVRYPSGRASHFTYDPLNRVTEEHVTVASASGQEESRVALYEYDGDVPFGNGRLTSARSDDATDVYRYDQRGRVIGITRRTGALSRSITLEISYDGLGRPTQIKYPDEQSVQYTYDGPFQRMLSDGSTGTPIQEVTARDALGRSLARRFGDGISEIKEYSPVGLPTKFQLWDSSGHIILEKTYRYDLEGNLLEVRSSDGQNLNAYYDGFNQMYFAGGSFGDLHINYDRAGNIFWTSNLGDWQNGGSPLVHPDAVVRAGSKEFRYDLDGNQVNGPQRDIAYEPDGRPIEIKVNGESYTLGFDAFGHLSSIAHGLRSVRTIGDLYTCSHFLFFKDCGRSIYIPDGGVAEAKAEERSYTYFHSDPFGSIVLITDTNGSVTGRPSYTPFGQPSDLPDKVLQWGMGGSRYIGPVGLYLMGDRRLYDPTIGRFLSLDSFAVPLARVLELNPYAYARNNPLTFSDSTGLFWERGMGGDDWWGQHSNDWSISRNSFYMGFSTERPTPFMSSTAFFAMPMGEHWSQSIGFGRQSSVTTSHVTKVGILSAAPTGMALLESGRVEQSYPELALLATYGMFSLGRELAAELVVPVTRWLARQGSAIVDRLGTKNAQVGGQVTKLLESPREFLLRKAGDPRLRDAIDQLYRPSAKIGNGSSMDAFRQEGSHRFKNLERWNQLLKVVRDPNVSEGDRAIASDLLVDIQNALSGF